APLNERSLRRPAFAVGGRRHNDPITMLPPRRPTVAGPARCRATAFLALLLVDVRFCRRARINCASGFVRDASAPEPFGSRQREATKMHHVILKRLRAGRHRPLAAGVIAILGLHAGVALASLVSSCLDDGNTDTLRYAVLTANPGDTIDLGALAC